MSNVKECTKCGKMEVHNKDVLKPGGLQSQCRECNKAYPVSYTHLTLPTILLV